MWPRFLFASHQHIIPQTFRPNTWKVQIWRLPGYYLHELHLKHATKTINISPTKQDSSYANKNALPVGPPKCYPNLYSHAVDSYW